MSRFLLIFLDDDKINNLLNDLDNVKKQLFGNHGELK